MRRLTPVVLGPQDGEVQSRLFRASWDPADDQRLLRNVAVATLTPYLPDPDARTGTSVVVAPGGGLHFLAVENEGSHVAERLAQWATPLRGASGYSLLGAVVGATYPAQLAELREAMPGVLFLVPGYGTQGGTAADTAAAFERAGAKTVTRIFTNQTP